MFNKTNRNHKTTEIMESLFINYDQALALKELHFDEPCLAIFTNRYTNGETYPKAVGQHEGSNISGDKNSDFDGQSFWYVTAPTFSQAFKFFRDKYRLDGKPEYFLNDWYCFIINDMEGKDTSRRLFTEFTSYEEAELQCLKKLIEIAKEK